MKIFLAGRKPEDIRQDWRFAATAGRIVSPYRLDDVESFWEPEERSIYGKHAFTGPFYAEDGGLNGLDSAHRAALIISAVLQSHLVFAWVDEPDPDVFWALGIAQVSDVRTAVGSSRPLSHSHVFYEAADFRAQTNIPTEALLRSITDAERANIFFNGSWKLMESKFDGVCGICSQFFEAGDPIMWRKKEKSSAPKTSETAHVPCFMYGAPINAIPRDLQTIGTEIVKRRLEELETENQRLLETVRDLASSST